MIGVAPGTKLNDLRAAVRSNRFSFPAQAPIFVCQSRAEIQWRVAVLYFVRGWSCLQLGNRYSVTPNRIRQLLYKWVERAIALGYLQHIPPASSDTIAPVTFGTVNVGNRTFGLEGVGELTSILPPQFADPNGRQQEQIL
jgi:hypothetical protein